MDNNRYYQGTPSKQYFSSSYTHSSPGKTYISHGDTRTSATSHYGQSHVIKRVVISPGGTRREVDYNQGDGSSVDRFATAF